MRTAKGINLFWDHQKKAWVPKRLDLKRIPLKYRCPTCGKIVVKPEDRNPRKVVLYDRYLRPEKIMWVPNKFECTAETELGGFLGYGGVCQKCWLDGLGSHGAVGRFFKKQLEESGELVYLE